MSVRERELSLWLPLNNYALIGDGQSCALVSNEGAVEWWCPERFDSPSVCARLLGEGAGLIATFVPIHHAATISYEPDTNIVVHEFRTADAHVRVRTFMPYPRDAQPCIIQLVEGLRGAINVVSEVNPSFDYGRIPSRWEGTTARWEQDQLVVSSSMEWTPPKAPYIVKEGDTHALVVTTGSPEPRPLQFALNRLETTRTAWRTWVARCTYTGRYRDLAVRSILALKLLQHPSGSFVAAPTTSLPEQLGGIRNWDYRYMWIRDSVFIVMAFDSLGFTEEVHDFRAWLARIISRDKPEQLQPFYRVDGERDVGESVLDHLPGYRNSSPVRIGNAAFEQYQFDIYGEVILCFHRAPEFFEGDLRDTTWKAIADIADFVCSHWKEPNEDFWEVPRTRRMFTYSKALGLMALRRTLQIAHDHGFPASDTWEKTCAEIERFITDEAYDPDLPAYIRAPGRRDADASLLLLPIIGVTGYDKRYIKTLSFILDNLSEGDFLQRYLINDNLPGREGAFLPATFWASNALADLGRVSEAKELFERAVRVSTLGLYSEEVDAQSGTMIGNYPQALSHLSLILAAIAIDNGEKKVASVSTG